MKKPVILCIDDEAIILMALIQELRTEFGNLFIYEKAINAVMATKVIQELEAEGLDLFLVICDWVMPGLSGDKFLEQIRHKYPEVQTIMLTGQADFDSIHRVQKRENVLAVLRKPWRSSDLADVIRKQIEKEKIGAIVP